MIGELLNFKQGRIADSRENVEILQQKVEQHENQISQQTVFSKIESLDSADNLYHMSISVNDGSGSLEVVDKADEDTSDGKMSVVGLNMYKSSIASLMNEVNELKDKFMTFEPILTSLKEKQEYEQKLNNWIELLSTPDVVIPEETMEQIEAADAAIKSNYDAASELELHFLDCLSGWKISQPAENESYDDKVWRWANMIQHGTGIVWNTADKADADQTYATLKDKDREELSNGEAEFVNSYRMEWDS